MAAVTTLISHVSRASDFYSKTSLYFAIAHPDPWSDENNPPEPNVTDTDLISIIGYKKVDTKYFVVPDSNGTISMIDGTWSIVNQADIYSKGAKWLYLETTIMPADLPLGTYRQVGLYSSLILADGVSPSKYNLLPSEVTYSGILEALDNRQQSNRQSNSKEKIAMILEF